MLVALVAILMATGVLKFRVSVAPSGENEQATTTEPKKEEFVLPEGWQKYTSGEFGYSVAYPDSWNVTENNDQGSRDLLIVAPKGAAFVRIAGFYDSSLTSPAAVEESIVEYKASFENKPSEQLKEFQSKMQGNIGGFEASGFMEANGVVYQFLERGILSSNGLALIMRGAVDTTEANLTQEEFDSFVSSVKQVMNSFKVQ